MRKLSIRKMTGTDSLLLTVSKNVAYVLFKDEYRRINVDMSGISKEEQEIFPEKLSSNILLNVKSTTEHNMRYKTSSAYFSSKEMSTVKGLLNSVRDLLLHMDLEPKFIHSVSGKREISGEISFETRISIAAKIGNMYISMLSFNSEILEDDLNIASSSLKVTFGAETKKSVVLRGASSLDLSITNDDRVIVRSLDKNVDRAKEMIKNILIK